MRNPPKRSTRSLRLAAWAVLCTVAWDAGAAESASLLDAAKSGTALELRGLLKNGANPNEADRDGTTALHWVVHRGTVDAVSDLLAAGAAVDAENRYGVRPSYLAAENGDAATMRAAQGRGGCGGGE